MSEASFQRSLREAVRGYWSGALSESQFESAMESTIRRGIVQAWIEGASECGVNEDELTETEIDAQAAFIITQFDYIGGFAEAIAESEKLEPMFTRAGMWANRYNEAKFRAASLTCADEKRQWRLGPTEQHCVSCAGFSGRVYRYSAWAKHNALPRNSALACHGFNCKCSLEPTTRPITKGKFPVGLLR